MPLDRVPGQVFRVLVDNLAHGGVYGAKTTIGRGSLHLEVVALSLSPPRIVPEPIFAKAVEKSGKMWPPSNTRFQAQIWKVNSRDLFADKWLRTPATKLKPRELTDLRNIADPRALS